MGTGQSEEKFIEESLLQLACAAPSVIAILSSQDVLAFAQLIGSIAMQKDKIYPHIAAMMQLMASMQHGCAA